MIISDRMAGIQPFFVMEVLSRAKALERQGRDVIHMEIGEPDFPTPPLVIRHATEFMQRGEIKYTPAAGLPELREAISEYYRDRYGVRIASERIFITPGASGGFLLAMGLLLNEGDKVLLADPGYPCYSNFARLFGGIPSLVPVDASTRFHLNSEMLSACWDSRTKGAVIASPSNPAGAVLQPEELKRLVNELEQKSAFLIADEIYHGLEYDKPSPTALTFSDRVFVVNSFSKYFGMTGWRVGWLAVPANYIDDAEKLAQNIFISAPAPSQYAALASFTEANLQELERRRLVFQERRDFLCENLQKIGFSVNAVPNGAFYVYAECSRFTSNSLDFALNLLEETGVAVTPGKDFGKNLPERHLRFSYAVTFDRLAEAITRIRRFVQCRS
ncbi:aminotransferase class I/II-fold pyridoxal phosphate-dependent enzyme [Methylocaldum sp.]|uniref:aminotransferase class I/II-fold pyridoxal phosphate-dependent enzyme n=1 Tax=Methylocaldum sp. TaxID=1969727 RepID=UPI002D3323F5|nr:aminotransferase class I/II-fold pyridoxal phosphate-dependent enzyme [Methylocaldum sp.]HYE37932.1 aminotransferase class I/II-fold pyridoxal phosphate-dependent enzyme [Methylocaldum sp.]